MDFVIELIATGLFVLILGSYSFTFWVWRLVSQVWLNHIRHLAQRVSALEKKKE